MVLHSGFGPLVCPLRAVQGETEGRAAPEAQARYKRHLAVRRENDHRKKQAKVEAAQAS